MYYYNFSEDLSRSYEALVRSLWNCLCLSVTFGLIIIFDAMQVTTSESELFSAGLALESEIFVLLPIIMIAIGTDFKRKHPNIVNIRKAPKDVVVNQKYLLQKQN